MNVRYRKRALAHLVAIHQYIAEDNPRAAESVVKRIQRTTDRLALFPNSGRRGLILGTRELVLAGLPYVIVYRIVDDYVEVTAIFHAARRR